MIVSAWKGRNYGIRVGMPNIRKNFNPKWESIEVEIEGTLFFFKLYPTFWTTCPEFRGKPIKKWLHKKGLIPWPKGNPPKFELIQLKDNKFRLQNINELL